MRKLPGKILMLVENYFPQDPRVRREAFSLRDAGYKVTIIALGKPKLPRVENVNGVMVYRVPRFQLFQKSRVDHASFLLRFFQGIAAQVGYLAEYFYFTSACFILSPYILSREGFDVIHAHNPPDTLFLLGLFYKLIGKKFVFDHHDLSPELYQSRYGKTTDLSYRVLRLIEQFSYRTADMVIATNNSYREIALRRGKKKPEQVSVVRNGPDLRRVKLVPPDPDLKKMNKTILSYLGAMNPQDGVDYLLRSLHYLAYHLRRTDFYCVIIGSGDALNDLKTLNTELKLEQFVWFTGYIPDEEMLCYLSTADICVDPDPSSPLNDKSTWIKIMEYMALKKPIVTFDLKETHFSAQEAAVYVPPNDEKAFAEAIAYLMDNPQKRRELGEVGYRRVVNELAWPHVSKNLLQAYYSLFRVTE